MRNNSKRFTRFGSANNAYHRVDFHAANTQHVESQWATTRRKIYHTREMPVFTQWIELSSSSTKWWDCWGEGKYYAVEREARVIVMRQKRLNEEKKTKAKVSVSSLPHLKTTTSWNKKKSFQLPTLRSFPQPKNPTVDCRIKASSMANLKLSRGNEMLFC